MGKERWFMCVNGHKIRLYGTIAYTEWYPTGQEYFYGDEVGVIYMTAGGNGYGVDQENWDKVQPWLRMQDEEEEDG